MININDFDPNLLKIDKKSYKGINIYYIGYITMKHLGEYNKINSVNPLYLIINHASDHIEEQNGNKYLVFDSTDKKLIDKFTKIWNKISLLIKTINHGKEIKYGKDFIKIKFDSDNDLPLKSLLKFHAMTIIIRSIFENDGKFYPQIYLDGCLHDL